MERRHMTIGLQQNEHSGESQWNFSQTHLSLNSDVDNQKTTLRYQVVSKGDYEMPVPVEPSDEARAWWVILFPIVVGILALFFFLSMGGLFAVIAPWVILAGIQSVMKRKGWQFVGILTGVIFIALGVAALVLPGHSGSWHSGFIAGLTGIIGGAGYIGFMLWEMSK
jgi:hypothetical protein